MNQCRTVRLPIHVIRELATHLKASRALEQKLNRRPSVEELADELDVDLMAVRHLLELNEPTTSADAPAGMGAGRAALDSIADETRCNPELQYADKAAENTLQRWLGQLTAQQRHVLEQRFGLRGNGRSTLEGLGRLMGLTRERVRQIQMGALERLREISSREGYAEIPFMD
jgi:RNA polymerase nonessential primary-like sigma factor